MFISFEEFCNELNIDITEHNEGWIHAGHLIDEPPIETAKVLFYTSERCLDLDPE